MDTKITQNEVNAKFNVGDVVKVNNKTIGVVLQVLNEGFGYETNPAYRITYWRIRKFANGLYDGSNGIRLATKEEIAKWNEKTLQPNHLHYSKSQRKIIHWFLPFDKCLMRDSNEYWLATIFSFYHKHLDRFVSIGGRNYGYCLPYNEKTAKLIGTTDDCKEE